MLKPYASWQASDLVALFAEYDLQPRRGMALAATIWREETTPFYACATGVLALHEGYPFTHNTDVVSGYLTLNAGYPMDWLSGIVHGFDDSHNHAGYCLRPEVYQLGYDLGKAVAQILFAPEEAVVAEAVGV